MESEREDLVRKFTERAAALGARVERFSDFDSCRKFIGKFLKDRRPRGIAASEALRKKFQAADPVRQTTAATIFQVVFSVVFMFVSFLLWFCLSNPDTAWG